MFFFGFQLADSFVNVLLLLILAVAELVRASLAEVGIVIAR